MSNRNRTFQKFFIPPGMRAILILLFLWHVKKIKGRKITKGKRFLKYRLNEAA